ncbi:sulfotransferase [Spirulina sp. 06S082]|uniref:sulfotransferase family protein n=1 Tax=Spirulina sp. 06S082 TaxID=3110248 RepID=UPI002B1F9FCF|nr:sulfotransferase [Spirulina sp. 06S082]MEA5472294.1 sulfotransferase [Spirulina sp. 06S082]
MTQNPQDNPETSSQRQGFERYPGWKQMRKKRNAQLDEAYLLNKDKFEQAFQEIDRFCLFIGYPRSGHTIVGSLLDAHPNIIIAHEQDVLEYIRRGVQKKELYHFLLNNSQRHGQNREDLANTGKEKEYSYNVPNQWQGRFQKLKVIGDNKGGSTSRQLGEDISLLETTSNIVNKPIDFIHVIRNPYDNIASILVRGQGDWSSPEFCIKKYFSLCEIVERVQKKVAVEQFHQLRHEDFIVNPQETLTKLCEFLGQSAPEDYLCDCASIVFASPNKTRTKIQWKPEEIERIQAEMEKFDFLKGYSFTD